MRMLEVGLVTARAFITAADRVRRTSQGVSYCYVVLDGAKGNPDPTVYERAVADLSAAQNRAADAITDAENAYTELRLLAPTVAEPARKYLDLCNEADAYPDAKRQEREAARAEVETTLQKVLGTLSKQ